jgi:hypothetical protein
VGDPRVHPVVAADGPEGRASVAPFLAGAALGAAAGLVAGTLLSRHAVHLIAALIGAVDRRLTRDERDQLRFELLLQ